MIGSYSLKQLRLQLFRTDNTGEIPRMQSSVKRKHWSKLPIPYLSGNEKVLQAKKAIFYIIIRVF